MRCSLKEEHLRCLGMGLLLSILKLWLVWMNQVKALFLFFKKKHYLRPVEVNRNVLSDHKLSNYPLSCCVSPPVLPSCAIYACCHRSWATTNAEQQLAETVSTF